MIKSMTGFGRCLQENEDYRISVEIKAVNHRYCEVSVKMPKKISFFEPNIRSVLKEYAERGKIDIFIVYEDFTEKDQYVKYNRSIAKEYLYCMKQMAEEFGIENDMKTSILSKMPEVLVLEEQEINEEALWSKLEPVIRKALEQFVETRAAEGQRLKEDVSEKLNKMLLAITEIEKRTPKMTAEYRKKIQERVAELLGDATKIDEPVIATEIVIFADKVCVDEETVRLKSHIAAMKEILGNTKTAMGRRLDFIAQEMNREANTILSKANDMEISDYAIELKTEIEKIREQIQNIE